MSCPSMKVYFQLQSTLAFPVPVCSKININHLMALCMQYPPNQVITVNFPNKEKKKSSLKFLASNLQCLVTHFFWYCVQYLLVTLKVKDVCAQKCVIFPSTSISQYKLLPMPTHLASHKNDETQAACKMLCEAGKSSQNSSAG